jgi:hypothetical protein
MSKLTARLPLIAAFLVTFASFTIAQEATPDAAKQQEEKAKLEAKATALLEQVVSESQGLKLPENRVRVAIVAGDLLWDRSPARARTFFADAASILANSMAQADDTDARDSDRRDFGMLNALRRELVLSAARHDAELAYQLLRQTQPPAGTNAGNRRRGNFADADNLEQTLLTVIAASDPKVAYQKAVESLDKGEYPTSLSRILSQLQTKDEEAFKKLSEKTLNRLSSENLLTSGQAVNVAMSLLRPGPQAATTAPAPANNANARANNSKILTESAFHDLLNNTVTAALTATPRTNTGGGNQPGRAQRRQGVMMGSGDGPVTVYMEPPRNNQQQLDPAQVQQNNARMLLRNLQGMLPQIDQYLPERGQAVRQKLTELGMTNSDGRGMSQLANQIRSVDGSSESIETAAAMAPPQLQSRFYEAAARRAVEEGNTDRALQLANDHLDESDRASVMQAIDFKKMTATVSEAKLNEIRQKLAALPSDAERVKYLGDLVAATQKDNPKLALRFAEDARALVTKRASDYRDLENQIRVAELFAPLDPKRSFEVLEPGIAQLNELLAAAQILNGFEVQVFRDGELPLQGGSELGRVVARFGQQLASLAKSDFERAQATADRFQFAEPRLMSKLSIVQGAFGVRQPTENIRRFENFRFMTTR